MQRLRVVPAYLRRLESDAVVPVGDLDTLADVVAGGDVVVLSGAGLSTESGIPDYRGPRGALRRHAPMTYQEFTADAASRRRYWARSFIGWPRIAAAVPNAGHRAVAELEQARLVNGIVTQNVDGLHQAGGARTVVDLHGRLDRVVCLVCRAPSSRLQLEHRLREANPDFAAAVAEAMSSSAEMNPDGDVTLPDHLIERFVPVRCAVCASDALKPDVVFFGESVPPDRVAVCTALVERAQSLVVLGSSLTVMSGYRFVLMALERDIPVAIVNSGPTRGDGRAVVRIDAPLGPVLTGLVERLAERRPPVDGSGGAGTGRTQLAEHREQAENWPGQQQPGDDGPEPLDE